jgi:hypothetical protein
MGIALLVAYLADILLAPALLRIYFGIGQADPLKRFDVPMAQNV